MASKESRLREGNDPSCDTVIQFLQWASANETQEKELLNPEEENDISQTPLQALISLKIYIKVVGLKLPIVQEANPEKKKDEIDQTQHHPLDSICENVYDVHFNSQPPTGNNLNLLVLTNCPSHLKFFCSFRRPRIQSTVKC